MKNRLVITAFTLVIALYSCSSGQDSTVDSHPSGSSVKAGSGKSADSTKKDSVKSDHYEQ